ncbi:hypothetical protein BN946_scf184962.g18 [Trametes cinnabarina]|uniref:Uncharacterized protein n=1 Tax=Pycnoporus cinnabarinus TaxID=5643 RepID=A0A060SCI5_PYCCI|nr:hypothetical protein BN946_scf184962.g18 [Trametes cinnabarina]
MAFLRVWVAQFYNGIGANGVRPYHWQVCIETGTDGRGFPRATTFTIKGSPATGFITTRSEHLRFTTADLYRGAVCVGKIQETNFGIAAQCIEGAELYRQEFYDSQDWAEAAVRKLYANGLIAQQWSKTLLQQELREAEAAWERGDA